MMGPYKPQKSKRAISVLDQDYELLGLSRNHANDEESFPHFAGSSVGHLDDLNADLVNDTGLKMPF